MTRRRNEEEEDDDDDDDGGGGWEYWFDMVQRLVMSLVARSRDRRRATTSRDAERLHDWLDEMMTSQRLLVDCVRTANQHLLAALTVR